MSRSYLETIFRHKMLLLTPVLIAVVLGTGYAFMQPRKYTATAAIWADTMLPSASTVGTTGTSAGNTPPAAGQQALLTDFLATKGFGLKVARDSLLPGYGGDSSSKKVDQALAKLAASITTGTPGPNVMTVAVRQETPARATAVAQAVVNDFLDAARDTVRRRGDNQVQAARRQNDAAAKTVSDAQQALSQYLQTHPAAQSGGDSTADGLRDAVTRAQEQQAAIQRAYQDATAAVPNVDDSVMHVMDAPAYAIREGRFKNILLGGVGGLLAGLSVATATLVLLFKRDESVYDESDIAEQLGLQVVGTVASFKAPSVPAYRKDRAGGGRSQAKRGLSLREGRADRSAARADVS